MSMTFAYVQFSRWDFGAFRLFGPGLGNLLFPWARAVVASETHKLTPVWPTWRQFKIGPVIRGELDRRAYSGMFQNPGDYVAGAQKLWVLATAKRASEHSLADLASQRLTRRETAVCFKGMRGLFAPLIRHRDLVREKLLNMAGWEHFGGMSHDFQKSITVHVRLADFRAFNDEKVRAGEFNFRLPQSWIVETIKSIRASVGEDWPVWLFSDGRNAELADLLSLHNVHRLHFGSALADMLAMSRSNVLLVSSTFSMWSSFLGGVPSIYYPGQLRQRLIAQPDGGEIEREPGSGISQDFLDAVYHKMETAL